MRAAPATAERLTAPAAPRRRPLWATLLRALGWVFIAAGTVVLLYVVYTLFFTNLTTNAAQSELLDEWEDTVGELDARQDTTDEVGGDPGDNANAGGDPDDNAGGDPDGDPAGDPAGDVGTGLEPDSSTSPAPDEPIDVGAAVAVLEFLRPGAAERPVRAEPVFVVEGVAVVDLQRGPGHYPGTALPGQDGNFAVAGHRTTYGAPFHNLDELAPGDVIRVTDRQGERWTYTVRETTIVAPWDTWVLGPDPLGSQAPTLTLTTCHPRFSARERLIVFAELDA